MPRGLRRPSLRPRAAFSLSQGWPLGVLVLALLAWPALLRRLALPVRPSAEGASLAVMLVLLGVALLVWLFNPFACLLLVPAVHLWLLAVELGLRSPSRARVARLLAVVLGALPLVLLLVLYSRELGLGPGELAESVVLGLAGGQVGPLAALLWSAAFGCMVAGVSLAPTPLLPMGTGPTDWTEVSTRGPTSYAGPGSLGGTESALRR